MNQAHHNVRYVEILKVILLYKNIYKLGYRFLCCGSETIPCRHAFHPICAYLHGLTIDI